MADIKTRCKFCDKPTIFSTDYELVGMCQECYTTVKNLGNFLKNDKAKLYTIHILQAEGIIFRPNSMYTSHIKRAKEEMEKIINE